MQYFSIYVKKPVQEVPRPGRHRKEFGKPCFMTVEGKITVIRNKYNLVGLS